MPYCTGVMRIKSWIDDGLTGRLLNAHIEQTGW